MVQIIRKIQRITRVFILIDHWRLFWLSLETLLKDENNLNFKKSDLIGQNHYSFCFMEPLKLMYSDKKKKPTRHQNLFSPVSFTPLPPLFLCIPLHLLYITLITSKSLTTSGNLLLLLLTSSLLKNLYKYPKFVS